MATKKKTVATTDNTSDQRVAEVREISDKEVLVIRTDETSFRCHPDDIGITLDEQDSAE